MLIRPFFSWERSIKEELGSSRMHSSVAILVVDDENGVRQSLNMVLKDDFDVRLAGTGAEAFEIFKANAIDLVLLDIRLPDIDGIELLKRFKEMEPGTEVVMVTAVKEIQTAVRAIKLGAYEYLVKPFEVDEVLAVIDRALEKRRLVKEVTYLRRELERYQPFEKMIGNDRKLRAVFDLISDISAGDGPVLIQGESGTGKELVARAIHNVSPRRSQPFVVINCAAIPPNLMESEIFGHTKGAFTGASSTTLGKLEIANKGTVFLDDVDILDVNMQAKLLRVIQEKEFERVGSTKVIRFDVRFVAASNKDLQEMIAHGAFREDLFYRLNVFPVKLPPLRERRGDIPLLLEYFLEVYAKRTGAPPKRFAKKAMDALTKYNWPGNVRELQNLVERLCTVTKKPVIYLQDISLPSIGLDEIKGMTLKDATRTFEKKFIAEVLDSVDGSRKNASEILGIHRNTLLLKMNDLGLKS